MKKIILSLLLFILIATSIFLISCTTECDHAYLTSTRIAPTCAEEGYTLNKCTECQAEFKTNYQLPTGHNLTETLFSPTCDAEGYTYYSCECGYSYKSNAIPPSGHIYNETKMPVSCETAGYTEHKCRVCEYSYKSDFISALGHDMVETIIFPTETQVGYTEYTCKTCSKGYKTNYVFYSDIYGGGEIETPVVVSKGIDVSKWQNRTTTSGTYRSLDWQKIKESGIDFAILRAGYTGSSTGSINKDPVFELNYADAKAAGVMVGAYYYSIATTEEKLDEEISALLEWLDGKEFEYPIYIDIEDNLLLTLDSETLTRLCMKFVTVMRENGFLGAVYSNKNWLEKNLDRSILESFCDLWFANYVNDNSIKVNDEYVWISEDYGRPLAMWQYTDNGIIENCGMASGATVDMNYCYKDYPYIMKAYGLNGYSIQR